uniref:G-protein coupled receptors family 1 profile domain-containing protein n=1 Tax=Timema bartmani TaxID=61472 RepID=A0A7R9F701_9NEOP|nr:unnamed protein product [Timema bartmani]
MATPNPSNLNLTSGIDLIDKLEKLSLFSSNDSTLTESSVHGTVFVTNFSAVFQSNSSVQSPEWWSTGKIQIPLYSVIFLLAVIGNSLVILTLVVNQRMRTITNLFLLNLAVSDLLLGVVCMPFTLIGALLRDFVFGALMCKLIPYLQEPIAQRAKAQFYKTQEFASRAGSAAMIHKLSTLRGVQQKMKASDTENLANGKSLGVTYTSLPSGVRKVSRLVQHRRGAISRFVDFNENGAPSGEWFSVFTPSNGASGLVQDSAERLCKYNAYDRGDEWVYGDRVSNGLFTFLRACQLTESYKMKPGEVSVPVEGDNKGKKGILGKFLDVLHLEIR